jgi:hypothetical protein
MQNGSNHAVQCKDVPFRSNNVTTQHLAGHFSQTSLPTDISSQNKNANFSKEINKRFNRPFEQKRSRPIKWSATPPGDLNHFRFIVRTARTLR